MACSIHSTRSGPTCSRRFVSGPSAPWPAECPCRVQRTASMATRAASTSPTTICPPCSRRPHGLLTSTGSIRAERRSFHVWNDRTGPPLYVEEELAVQPVFLRGTIPKISRHGGLPDRCCLFISTRDGPNRRVGSIQQAANADSSSILAAKTSHMEASRAACTYLPA